MQKCYFVPKRSLYFNQRELDIIRIKSIITLTIYNFTKSAPLPTYSQIPNWEKLQNKKIRSILKDKINLLNLF